MTRTHVYDDEVLQREVIYTSTPYLQVFSIARRTKCSALSRRPSVALENMQYSTYILKQYLIVKLLQIPN